jgi:hypothetical protein
MKKEKKFNMVKLPDAAVMTMRKRGGAHSTKKGQKGYSRKKIAKPDFDNPVFLNTS